MVLSLMKQATKSLKRMWFCLSAYRITRARNDLSDTPRPTDIQAKVLTNLKNSQLYKNNIQNARRMTVLQP